MIVTVAGEVDAYSGPELTARLEEAGRDGASPLVVDVSRVTFMDSTVLGAIVRALKAARERDVAARVVLPQTAARRIFEITTLDRSLPVAASREDAVAELCAGR